MALATYEDLIASIKNWLHRADMSAYAPDLVTFAEDRINLDVRCREMETALSVSISGGVAAVPSDFTALKYAYIDGSPVQALAVKPAEWVIGAFPVRSSTGKPRYIGVDGSNFVFGPYADSSYTVAGTYYKQFGALSSSVNALFTRVPSLYLFAAMAEAGSFLKNDQEAARWEAKYAALLSRINSVKSEGDYSGGGLAVTTDFATR